MGCDQKGLPDLRNNLFRDSSTSISTSCSTPSEMRFSVPVGGNARGYVVCEDIVVIVV